MNRKGIILAGGHGTRLYPLTKVISKQLCPVYDKPVIYYSLSTLMHAGIRDILIITAPGQVNLFKDLLGDGSNFGIKLSYQVQETPRGLADAFILGEEFIDSHPSCLILGDNIFYGHDIKKILVRADENKAGATVFCYHVQDPERYGIAEFKGDSNVVSSIAEKPAEPKSNWAITGLYFYDEKVCQIAKNVTPSARGEIEITCVNKAYLDLGELRAEKIGRGYSWFDTGTHKSLLDAAQFVSVMEERQGLKIGCPEEIAFHQNWLSTEQLENITKAMGSSEYGLYLKQLLKNNPMTKTA